MTASMTDERLEELRAGMGDGRVFWQDQARELFAELQRARAHENDLITYAREVTERYPIVAGHVIQLVDAAAPEKDINEWNDWCKAVLSLESVL